MTREQIQSLEKLGFEWELRAAPSPYTWEEHRQQLADFKEEFDHTNVPQSYAENKPLANWVKRQKNQYKLFKASKTSSMTREQIQSLEELGFESQPKTRTHSLLLVEKTPLVLSAEDGYESNTTSEFDLII